MNPVPFLQSLEQLCWGPSTKVIITMILRWKTLTHTQTKILIQSVNYCSGQDDYAKEAIRFVVRALQHDRTATKKVSGRHSHFGHPYGACVQFRDALVCLITTFPNSIILQQQHYQEKIGMIIYNVFPHRPRPLHEISLFALMKKKKKRLQVSKEPLLMFKEKHIKIYPSKIRSTVMNHCLQITDTALYLSPCVPSSHHFPKSLLTLCSF